jgi:glycosyltransferase involved in cell wall biosynthesis
VKKLFTPSEYVKQKVMKRFGIKNVTVTPNGVDRSIFHPDAKQTQPGLPAGYILFVGTLEPRKNLGLLLRAWSETKDDFKDTWLMIAGMSGNVFRAIHLAHESERVHFLGYVDDESLAGLYANATLFILPSQDEGFGLPALEAMASGVPVIVSDGGALPEVVAEAGMTFCLSDPTELTNLLKEGLSNARLRARLREKGLERAKRFSWQQTAELIWKNLHEL